MTGELIDLANRGLPISGEAIVDSHSHMGPYWNFHIPENDADGMLESMDSLGIDTAIITPLVSIGPGFQSGNSMAERAAQEHPGRFYGALSINPNYPKLSREELSKYEGSPHFKAIKLHPSLQKYPAGGDVYRLVYSRAADMGIPVATHTWTGDSRCEPSKYGELADEFCDTKFILIHSGGTKGGIEEAIETALPRDNIYLETCGSRTFGIVEEMVDSLGSERVLFGSDMPFLDPAAQVGKIIYSDISEGDKLNILGLNATHVFNL